MPRADRGRLLLTGAAGNVGRFLRAGLPGLGWDLRLLDRAPVEGADSVVADINDAEALAAACEGVDAIVHLAGVPTEAPFDDILRANIVGIRSVFEAARRTGVPRIAWASSNHAVGFYPAGEPAPADGPPRPDSYYGVSKVFGEALASLYADKLGLRIASVRIGSCFERPTDSRQLATWLSPGDAVRLFDACLTAPGLRHSVVYGISANTRAYWDLTSARALGYRPQDDAEVYAPQLTGAVDGGEYLGGGFTRWDLPAD